MAAPPSTPPDPYFNPVEASAFSTLASEETSHLTTGRLYQRAFGDTRLSNSLALIVYSANCGFSDIESIPNVLTNLKTAIYESLVHCVGVDRPTYVHYIQQLSRKTDVLITRLIIPALKATAERPELVVTQQIIKDVHELVLLLYGFTNPLKIPGVLSDDYGVDGPHGLRFSSQHTTTLLAVSRKLQASLHASVKQVGCENKNGAGPNNTPLNLWNEWVAQSSQMVTKLIVTILNNTVPSVTVFSYFEELLKSKEIDILDLEYFDEFLCHLQRINKFAKTQRNSALFDAQKDLIQDHFLSVIRSFPSHPLSWCTVTQTVDYLQAFIDIYNDIYDDKLLIEKIADRHESTVVKRIVDVENFPNGHYINFLRQERNVQIPGFVKCFDSETEYEDKEVFIPISQPKSCESVRRASQKNIKYYLEGSSLVAVPESRSTEGSNVGISSASRVLRDLPEDPVYLEVFRLNEAVAKEVRELRSIVESRLVQGKKAKVCWRCKINPWHRHGKKRKVKKAASQ